MSRVSTYAGTCADTHKKGKKLDISKTAEGSNPLVQFQS